MQLKNDYSLCFYKKNSIYYTFYSLNLLQKYSRYHAFEKSLKINELKIFKQGLETYKKQI